MSPTPSDFHPIIHLPADYDVYDFTAGYDPDRPRRAFGVGRYDEHRRGMYPDGFDGRTVHMGIDLGCPAGTPVHAFADGRLLHQQDNAAPGDYGPTLVTEHTLDGHPIYLLLGHLTRASLTLRAPARPSTAATSWATSARKKKTAAGTPTSTSSSPAPAPPKPTSPAPSPKPTAPPRCSVTPTPA